MGVQARLPGRHANTASAKDEEALPVSVDDTTGGFKDHHTRRDALRRWLPVLTCGAILLYLATSSPLFLVSGSGSGRSLDFPWPRPEPPAPEPSFIKEGIKQCEIIQRPPPNHKPATAKRTINDRFVPGTKPVWLRNATVWTGEEGGEQVLYNTDVLLDGGVIRKIGKTDSDEVRLAAKDKKDIEEVQLHGAWLTPGQSTLLISSLTTWR